MSIKIMVSDPSHLNTVPPENGIQNLKCETYQQRF